jgi:pyruvate dehydrogenase E2 component (dihydrolipoamide acetyltransferase)
MAEVVRMPKMSDTMTEGVIAKWHKKVGDKISSGDLVAEIETDKATMDFESFQEGTLLYIGAKEGEAAPVDSVIAILGEAGEDFQALLKGASAPEPISAESKPADVAVLAEAGSGNIDVDAEAMGATIIRMPLLSDTMTEGVIAEWHKKVGDKVKSDDALADVETDKATMEVIGYADGTLLYVGVEKGQAAKVNDIIAIVGKEGTDVSALLKSGSKPIIATAVAEPKPAAASVESKPEIHTDSDSSSRLKASPLARKIAKDKGIDLAQVKGSAEGGRIVKKDIEGFTPSSEKVIFTPSAEAKPAAAAVPQFTGEEKYTEKPVSQMRKVIAKRLSESLFTAPHFYLTMSIDMDSAMQARTKINEFASVKISFNDLVVKAVAVALKQHPNVNSSKMVY